ncbi:M14 family zinc carboxypeptidase [Thermomonas sp.]|uniref:M14 family zinc carboxypeptidase n=1 Tax=Thermomonas sp. TaxID=1971895 RepID=UPI001AC63F44|nr:peptidase M14 [Xanthomonadales bacterium]MBN8768081.1 peptidase M14 [Stenotrophomonas sp.]
MPRAIRRHFLALALLTACLPGMAARPALSTVAERSGYQQTGRYDEVIALCAAYQQAFPKAVRCFDFGTTPQGRPMKALAISTSGALTAEDARARGLPVVLVQGGIHAGEIDGKDAGFALARDLLQGKLDTPGQRLLDRVVLLLVPVFNVDGHENFRAWNRPNQRGPEQMGFRVTAQRLNLNRDYVKADAPEMQAMLGLIDQWDPLLTLDLHVTDGAKFRHDISITGEPVNVGDEALRAAGRALKDGILNRLKAQGALPVGFYPSFAREDDPSSGFVESAYPPRFSSGYFPLRNRLVMLVETHSWKPYPARVRATYNAVLDALQLVAENGAQWSALAAQADARARQLGGTPVALDYRTTEDKRVIDFLGYAYQRVHSDISGGEMTVYDETTPQLWMLPLRDTIVPALSVIAPQAGYLVPAEYAAQVGALLRLHGIDFRTLSGPLAQTPVQAFTADQVAFSATPMEGHQRATLSGAWAPSSVDIGAGALFVPIAQPKARLLMAILEPQAPDSMAAWGLFNNSFERKEYMEGYVAEEQARRMLARDPALKAAFAQTLKDDPEFARSPRARLDFFYRRHPAWDAGYNRYPVLRTDRVPE